VVCLVGEPTRGTVAAPFFTLAVLNGKLDGEEGVHTQGNHDQTGHNLELDVNTNKMHVLCILEMQF